MKDNAAETIFQSFLREAIVKSSGMDKDVHSLTRERERERERERGVCVYVCVFDVKIVLEE